MGIARQSDGRELHLNIEHTKDQLGIKKSKAEELHKRAFKLTSELSESVLKLNKLRSEKARQKKILNLLETSLPAFQDLKRQWINLQNFLEKITRQHFIGSCNNAKAGCHAAKKRLNEAGKIELNFWKTSLGLVSERSHVSQSQNSGSGASAVKLFLP